MRKIVKSLSKVSEVDTKDIRKDISRSKGDAKYEKRVKLALESDKLLKERTASTPVLKRKYKLFDKSNKIGGLRDKKMES